MAKANNSHEDNAVLDYWPKKPAVPAELPERAAAYLSQALETSGSPSASVIMSASAVDSMLKDKGLSEGTLFHRIETASQNHLITEEMAAWAHEIHLEANSQRHADDKNDLPTTNDAHRMIDFAMALAQFMYVLPARVAKGRKQEG